MLPASRGRAVVVVLGGTLSSILARVYLRANVLIHVNQSSEFLT